MRQVTHALLTRPPLSHLSEERCFVRLACVKHAASVHPEPGSNSHVKKFVSVQDNTWLSIPFTVYLGSSIARLSVVSFSKDTENLIRIFKDLWLFSFQCSMLSFLTAFVFYQTLFCLSRTFLIYFLSLVLSQNDFYILTSYSFVVKNFFHFFFRTFKQMFVLFLTAYIGYQISLSLSRTFFNFFASALPSPVHLHRYQKLCSYAVLATDRKSVV